MKTFSKFFTLLLILSTFSLIIIIAPALANQGPLCPLETAAIGKPGHDTAAYQDTGPFEDVWIATAFVAESKSDKYNANFETREHRPYSQLSQYTRNYFLRHERGYQFAADGIHILSQNASGGFNPLE